MIDRVLEKQPSTQESQKNTENNRKLSPTSKEHKFKPEQELINIIEGNIDAQPETTRHFWENNRSLLVKTVKIDNKIWSFTSNSHGLVMALVNSDQDPTIFRPRFFRVSGSDHQFKAFPGYRSDQTEVLKGQENNPNHHYIQSAKLNHAITQVLEELPLSSELEIGFCLDSYVPVMPNDKENKPGKNLEDLTFSEEQAEIKNKDWKSIQTTQKTYLRVYETLNAYLSKKSIVKVCYELVESCRHLNIDIENMKKSIEVIANQNNPDDQLTQLAHKLIESLFTNPHNDQAKTSADLQKQYRQLTMREIIISENPLISNFFDQLTQVSHKLIESFFTNPKMDSIMEQSGFIPNFNQEPIVTYTKKGNGKNQGQSIKVEVFETKSPEGDTLYWEMAQDSSGRVYIDNIYNPKVGIDSYGTPAKKTNFGLLIQKPEDYKGQVDLIPEKYLKFIDLSYYVDISALLEQSLPVRLYKNAKNSPKHKKGWFSKLFRLFFLMFISKITISIC